MEDDVMFGRLNGARRRGIPDTDGRTCNFYITMLSTHVLAISSVDDFIICFTYDELFHISLLKLFYTFRREGCN